MGLLAQATAVGGIVLFGLIGSWVFGREYSDHTVKDLLALPTSCSAIVLAKFVVAALWSAMLTAIVYLIGLGVSAAVALPPPGADIFLQGTITLAITSCLTIALVTPITFFASAGHGYLPPIGVAILALILAQVIAAAGWGAYFPWPVPALFAGVAGVEAATLGFISYVIVLVTSFIGLVGTFVWWEMADQAQ